MVNVPEMKARIKDFMGFDRQEIISLVAAAVITAFIFTFRDWGDEVFNPVIGFSNLLIVSLIAIGSFAVRFFFQKLYALHEGYLAKFKIWWIGLGAAVVIAFLSFGRLSLVLIGTMSAALMVKQRLGEYRYGFSNWNNAMIAYWAVLAHLILALFLGTGAFFFPQSFFFSKGLLLNIVAAFCSFIPLPNLDGLTIFFGSRKMYIFGLIFTVFATILLYSKTNIGLIIAWVVAVIYTIVLILIDSEK